MIISTILILVGIIMLGFAGFIASDENNKCAGCEDPEGNTLCDNCINHVMRIRYCPSCKLSVSGHKCPMCDGKTVGGDYEL